MKKDIVMRVNEAEKELLEMLREDRENIRSIDQSIYFGILKTTEMLKTYETRSMHEGLEVSKKFRELLEEVKKTVPILPEALRKRKK